MDLKIMGLRKILFFALRSLANNSKLQEKIENNVVLRNDQKAQLELLDVDTLKLKVGAFIASDKGPSPQLEKIFADAFLKKFPIKEGSSGSRTAPEIYYMLKEVVRLRREGYAQNIPVAFTQALAEKLGECSETIYTAKVVEETLDRTSFSNVPDTQIIIRQIIENNQSNDSLGKIYKLLDKYFYEPSHVCSKHLEDLKALCLGRMSDKQKIKMAEHVIFSEELYDVKFDVIASIKDVEVARRLAYDLVITSSDVIAKKEYPKSLLAGIEKLTNLGEDERRDLTSISEHIIKTRPISGALAQKLETAKSELGERAVVWIRSDERKVALDKILEYVPEEKFVELAKESFKGSLNRDFFFSMSPHVSQYVKSPENLKSLYEFAAGLTRESERSCPNELSGRIFSRSELNAVKNEEFLTELLTKMKEKSPEFNRISRSEIVKNLEKRVEDRQLGL